MIRGERSDGGCLDTFGAPPPAPGRYRGVRAPARVIVSTACSDGSCVGVILDETVTVVDTKTDDGPRLTFTREEWAGFVAGVKNGEFDLP